MWFEALTGFSEESPEQVRANLVVEGTNLTSRVNGRQFACGTLETPTLAALRERVRAADYPVRSLSVSEVVANVQDLHTEAENAGALFQVAAQFNLLEMVSPTVTPEHGVDIYEQDFTQGPACAIACGAGTIFRNYLVSVDGQAGQSAARQIDCLAELGSALGNLEGSLWEMQNGYALASESGLAQISSHLRSAHESERDTLRQALRIGIHWDTQVTIQGSRHLVSQAYCSALPVAYSDHPSELWAEFAMLVLEASYEATICAAALNLGRTGNNRVFLTLLGGGAFGNETAWIIAALERALERYGQVPLDVAIVSHGTSNPSVRSLVTH